MNRDLISCSFINLEKRTDRLVQVQNNLQNHGFNLDEVYQFKAIEHEFGEVGCAKSHYLLLSEILCSSSSKYHLIFEDDFRFEQSQDFIVNFIMELEKYQIKFDIFNLYGEWPLALETEKIVIEKKDVSLFKVLNSQTTACYIVSNLFLPNIIHYYLECIEIFENLMPFLSKKRIREFSARNFSIDQYWRKMMANHEFVGCNLVFGYTEVSKSDIHYNQTFVKNPKNQMKISDITAK